MLEVRSISVTTRSFRLKDVSFIVKDNTTHTIIGPTGSGKTTILESLIGLRRPDSGEIILDGINIIDIPVEKRGLSYLPQDLCLFPHLTVMDNILYGLKIKRIKNRDIADKLIDTLSIGHLLNRKVTTLSGGERQRVALARALSGGNRYLLLDEPLSALHEGLKRDLRYLLKGLKEEYKLTMIMVTHDMEDAFFLSDTMSVVIDGMVQQTDTPGNIYKYPANLEVANFFGIKNLFKGEIEQVENDKLYIMCPEINATLTIQINDKTKSYKKGDSILICIRPENVMILRPDYMRKEQDNLIEGQITEIYEKGNGCIIFFAPQDAKRRIEIDVPDYAFKKLALRKGINATITLRHESIWLMNQKSEFPSMD